MTMTAPLDERIASALAGQPSAAELAALLDEARVADAAAEQDRLAARERALDPATPPAAVAEARKAMEDSQFVRDRLEVATRKLETLRQEATHREAEAARKARIADVTARRDALAAELRETYPALVTPLADLIRRVVSLDAECQQFGLHTAEQTARPGGAAATHQSFISIGHSRIVDFEVRPDGWLYVPGQNGAGPRRAVTVETVRVIVTNNDPGPRGVNAVGGTRLVPPGQTSEELTIPVAELAGLDRTFTVKNLGTGTPATRYV